MKYRCNKKREEKNKGKEERNKRQHQSCSSIQDRNESNRISLDQKQINMWLEDCGLDRVESRPNWFGQVRMNMRWTTAQLLWKTKKRPKSLSAPEHENWKTPILIGSRSDPLPQTKARSKTEQDDNQTK